MLETNVRIIHPGTTLFIRVRRANISGVDITRDKLERACGTLRYRYGLAAIPIGQSQPTLLVATVKPISSIHLEQRDWELDISDNGDSSRTLAFAKSDESELVTQLIERSLLASIARRNDLWTLDSPRIWYQAKPFLVRDGIAAYRRYEVAALPIDGIGVGIAVDVGTAFFTVENLAYFFEPKINDGEKKRREKLFADLTGRQAGQKGTLLYDNGRNRTKCYFESAPAGMTCCSSGKIRLSGKSYDSLLDYYGAEYPDLPVSKDSLAVRVSFKGIDRPQPVAAGRVWVRVMNDDLPYTLSSVDKIKPAERRQLVEQFWATLGQRPFGNVAPGLQEGFWRPDASRSFHLSLPSLIFGNGERLPAPQTQSVPVYRANYRQRLDCLVRAGCYYVPPTLTRSLFCAYPKHFNEEASKQLATDISEVISSVTHRTVGTTLIAYDSLNDAIEKLKAAGRGGLAIFVLNDEPAAYYNAAFHLPDWRLKRLTEHTISQHYLYLKEGARDRKTASLSLTLGAKRWQGFIHQNALDVLQLLDVVPYRLDQAGPYEAQLVIDVGHDRRNFALSLLVARDESKSPSFHIASQVIAKPDHQHEAINPVMLSDAMVAIFDGALRRNYDPITSLVVMRDGQFCGREIDGIDEAVERLVDKGKVLTNARVDLAEFRKETLKSIRIWDVDDAGAVENPLEATVLELNSKNILVASTGAATLHQGTADPFLITGNGRCSSPLDAARAFVDGAQLNWSSPRVAQRLSLPAKRTDEELIARAAQEIRRIR